MAKTAEEATGLEETHGTFAGLDFHADWWHIASLPLHLFGKP